MKFAGVISSMLLRRLIGAASPDWEPTAADAGGEMAAMKFAGTFAGSYPLSMLWITPTGGSYPGDLIAVGSCAFAV